MEAPTEKLQIFSSILLQEYIRLMTVAVCLQNPNKDKVVTFKMSENNYQKMLQEPLQSALLGLDVSWNNGIVSVIPEDKTLAQYSNKVMKESLLLYCNNYKDRYSDFISLADGQNI